MAKNKEKLTDADLIGIIEKRDATAINHSEGHLAQRRIEIMRRYYGKPYGNEKKGQSKVTTRQALEAVEWTLPSLLRVFLSSPSIVEFDPVNAEDEEQARQETIALHKILRRQKSFMKLFLWFKDAIMNPAAYIKVCWEEKTKRTVEYYTQLTPEEVERLLSLENTTPLEYDSSIEVIDTPMGPVEVEIYDLRVRVVTNKGCIVIELVPQEELKIGSELNTWDLDDAHFLNHTPLKTRSELIAMGFDEDVVNDLPKYAEGESSEKQTRHEVTRGDTLSTEADESNDVSTELVQIRDTYLYIDYDGDGFAEFRRIISCGDEILENEEIEENPFVQLLSVPLPHEPVGESWLELVLDLQKIFTTLVRQMLTNGYRANNPRHIVGPGVNMQDLLAEAGPIRARNVANVVPENVPNMSAGILPVLGYLDEMKEARTGVSKSTMGLDADALSRVTKGAWLGSLEQANQRLDALARLIAEMGVKPLMLKIHRLMRKHRDSAYDIKNGDKWITVDPRRWRDRDDMKVTVGLGTGNKQAQMAVLDKVVEYMKVLREMGFGRLIGEQHAYNILSEMVRVADLHNPEKYAYDPTTLGEPEPPPPDPAIQLQQQLVQVEQERNQLTHERELFKTEKKAAADKDKLMKDIAALRAKISNDDRKATNDEMEQLLKMYEILIQSELAQGRLVDQGANRGRIDQTQRGLEGAIHG